MIKVAIGEHEHIAEAHDAGEPLGNLDVEEGGAVDLAVALGEEAHIEFLDDKFNHHMDVDAKVKSSVAVDIFVELAKLVKAPKELVDGVVHKIRGRAELTRDEFNDKLKGGLTEVLHHLEEVKGSLEARIEARNNVQVGAFLKKNTTVNRIRKMKASKKARKSRNH